MFTASVSCRLAVCVDRVKWVGVVSSCEVVFDLEALGVWQKEMVEVKGEGKLGERGGGGGREEEENGTGVKGDGLNVCPDCGKKFERLSNLKVKHQGREEAGQGCSVWKGEFVRLGSFSDGIWVSVFS